MQVIFYGVVIDRFRPGNRQRKPGEPFRLLYVGSWMARKGVDLLAPIMRELGNGFELRYTGGKASERDKPGMPANMHDIDRLLGDAAIATAMQDADALLFPSRSEGFGLVAVEAMACGLPVIATRGSSLVEVVSDNATGILCPQDDVSAFVSAVRKLSELPPRAAPLSLAGSDHAAKHFGVSKMVDAYIQQYRALAISNTRSARS
jgi:glycosyltransferase involved in cell wall biosynthesis